MKKIVVTTALLAGILAQAGGFRVALQGVKQLAMAHTSAHAEDASVAFFNPAGISFIPNKLSVAAGGFGVNADITYQNPSTLESYSTENPMGTPIYAAEAGQVITASYKGAYGNCVIIDHGGSYSTLYGHQSRMGVSVGQTVSRGQVIGYVGTTGYSTGNHLHFEVRVNGVPQNPLSYT